MTEDELKAIEVKLDKDTITNIGERMDNWVGRDTDYLETSVSDVRALLAEVRRLRKRYETPATSANLPPDFIPPSESGLG